MEQTRNKLQEYLLQLQSVSGIETLTLSECFLLGYSFAKYEGTRKLTDIALFLVAVHKGAQQGFLDAKQKAMVEYLIFEGAYEGVPALLQTFSKTRIEELKKQENERESSLSDESSYKSEKSADKVGEEVFEPPNQSEFQSIHSENRVVSESNSLKRKLELLPSTQELLSELEKNLKRPKPDRVADEPKVIQIPSPEKDHESLEEEKKPEVNIKCGICGTEMFPIDVTQIQPCGHAFHPSCIRQFLIDHQNKKTVLCPMSICKGPVSLSCIEGILGKFKKPEKFCCPKAGCDYIFERIKGNEDSEFICPKCGGAYCLRCRYVYHKGKTCKVYQEENPSLEVVEEGTNLKECPKCKYWLEKVLGKTDLLCKCGYQFCYHCGEQYPECKCVKKEKEMPRVLPRYGLRKKI